VRGEDRFKYLSQHEFESGFVVTSKEMSPGGTEVWWCVVIIVHDEVDSSIPIVE